MQSSCQGIYTTVIDQAGRQRRQKTDALGRIVRVDEPDSNGNLGTVDAPTQATSYDYNTQGNLIHITQGWEVVIYSGPLPTWRTQGGSQRPILREDHRRS